MYLTIHVPNLRTIRKLGIHESHTAQSFTSFLSSIVTEDRLIAMQNSNSATFNLFNKSVGQEGAFKVATAVEKEQAIRVLAAGNALIGLVSAKPLFVTPDQMTNACPVFFSQCLLGILMMQAGQEYARQQEEREQLKIDMRSAAVSATAGSASPSLNAVPVEVKKDL